MGDTQSKLRRMSKDTSRELEEHVQQGAVSSFSCEICVQTVYSNRRFKNNRCSHDSYCMDCIRKYIDTTTEVYNLAEIKCPALDCNKVLDPLACRSMLSAKVFERWCDALCDSMILHKGYKSSHCPYCSSVFFAECNRITGTKCLKCNRDFCFKCKNPWNHDHVCVNSKRLENWNDILIVRLAEAKKWRTCPGCNIIVEKTQGCGSMKCRCGTKFSYGTGKSFHQLCFCACCYWEKLVLLVLVLTPFIILAIIVGCSSRN